MRKLEFFQNLDVFAFSAANRRRGPFAYAIHGYDGGFRERRGVECACRMGKMMFREIDGCIPLAELGEALFQHAPHEYFFFYPYQHCRHKTDKTAGRERVVRLQKSLELKERLFVKRNRGKVLIVDSCLFQDVADSVDWKGGIVLLARKTLFLRGSNDLAVNEKRGSAVVVKRRYPQYCFSHSDSFRLGRIYE